MKGWVPPTIVAAIIVIAAILISAFVPGGWATKKTPKASMMPVSNKAKPDVKGFQKEPDVKGFQKEPDVKGLSSCDGGSVYGCLTNLVGSKALMDAAKKDKYDGLYALGSLGNGNSQIGKCYELDIENRKKPVIGQVINQGSDLGDGQFDMYMADGGFGLFESCTKMYGGKGKWGHQYGGWDSKKNCDKLPEWPTDCPNGDCTDETRNLQELCKFSFEENLRFNTETKVGKVGALEKSNPKFSAKRVKCPRGLTKISGVNDSSMEKEIIKNGTLTRIMDCCKPSAAWDQGQDGRVITCNKDGYTKF